MAEEPSWEELNAAFGSQGKQQEPSYEELQAAYGNQPQIGRAHV